LDLLVQRASKFLGLVEQVKQNISSSDPHSFVYSSAQHCFLLWYKD